MEGDAVVTRGEDTTWEEKRDLALRDLLVRRGERVIGFDEYLDIVLYNPEWGYYASGNAKIGWEGADFFTNSSLGPIFAEAIGRFVIGVWEAFGRPREFYFCEEGAHDGFFLRDLLSFFRREVEFWDALRVIVFEPWERLRRRQMERLVDFAGKVEWLGGVGEKVDVGVYFCNELLDALPFKLVELRDGGWFERCVEVFEDGGLGWCSRPIGEGLAEFLASYCGVERLGEGYLAAVRPSVREWARGRSGLFERGVILVCDYGYTRSSYYGAGRGKGLVRCYSRHRCDEEPFEKLGSKDITAHVDFTQVAEELEAAGWKIGGFADQYHFLVEVLRGWLLEKDGRVPVGEEAKRMRSLRMLVHPEIMGRSFCYLAAIRNWPRGRAVPGFGVDAEEEKVRNKLELCI